MIEPYAPSGIPLSLIGKRALIGGSSTGIGLASAFVLSRMGAEVILIGRDQARLATALEQLDRSADQEHGAVVADYTDLQTALNSILDFVTGHPGPINILVNNTGGPTPGPLMEAQVDSFYEAFNAHILMAQLLTQGLVPGMAESGYGRIVNIISTSVKAPLHNLGVSNTIRGAMANWSKTMANELGPFGITVNNVLPGATATGRLKSIVERKSQNGSRSAESVEAEMQAEIPLRRFADPLEVGYAVGFLASPSAAYISGINLPVDGGRTPNL